MCPFTLDEFAQAFHDKVISDVLFLSILSYNVSDLFFYLFFPPVMSNIRLMFVDFFFFLGVCAPLFIYATGFVVTWENSCGPSQAAFARR